MATTTICGAVLSALVAMPAMAQDAAPAAAEETTTVVVTGSIIKRKNFQSISPLTVLSAADLEKRGVTTIESAVQNVAGNNGGAMNNNWSAAGNFAAGASGVSLRGLTTNSTLVLVDGMRLSYYPLADDATRNFVDLNTIPDGIVDHVDVLLDGASATYGSDAIAGVINVVTKKQIKGWTLKASVGGPTGHGGAGTKSISGSWGMGDINTDGYNFYVAGEYQHDDILLAKDADFPYNTADFSSICAQSQKSPATAAPGAIDASGKTCMTNGIVNGTQFDGRFAGIGTTTVPMVRPYNSTNTGAAQGNWQLLNPTAGCRDLTAFTVGAANLPTAVAGVPAGTKVCQQDLVKQFNTIAPEDTRKSVTARLTKRFSDTMEGYVSATFYQNETYYTGRGGPRNIQAATTPGAAGTSVNLTAIALPVWICNLPASNGNIYACDANSPGAKRNTVNNPFAANDQTARILYRFGDIPNYTKTKSETMRIAAGLSGSADGWDYNVNFTAMKTKLDYDKYGSIQLSHLKQAIRDGSYNFFDPSANSQAVRDFVAPPSLQKAESELVLGQVDASKPLMQLAGGPLTLGVGAALRYERVNNPSANPDPGAPADPFDRYDGNVNPFGAVGYRHVTSASFELDAPFTDNLDVNLAGRFDSYSTGFANFSPKISARYKPIETLTLRGTFSKGFRAPSIAETNSDPSTGFITLDAPDDFIALHNANGTPNYGVGYNVGLTTVAAKDLGPETSENTSLGAVWQPTKWLGFSFDYFNIHKEDIIAGGDFAPALDAYFAGQPIPAGYAVIPGQVDPNLPNALATPGFIQYGLQNLNAQDIAGFDASVQGRFNLGPVKYTTSLDASYIQYYSQTYADGSKQRYDGTLGNNQITSGSGTPKLKGNWQNVFEFGPASLTATAYYVSGYKAVAADNGDDIYGTCADGSTAAKYRDNFTVIQCNVDSFVSVDLHGAYKINANYLVYVDVLNAFGAEAPFDPSGTYRLTQYNPAFHGSGMMGQFVKVGGKVTF